jgi:hypothetical protein
MTNLQSLQIIWDALHEHIPEGFDEQWAEICEAMAHLHETFEIDHSEID